MLVLGENRGGGVCEGSIHFRVTTISDRQSPRGRAMSARTFTASVMEKNDKVSLDMTQVVSVLITAMIFIQAQAFES